MKKVSWAVFVVVIGAAVGLMILRKQQSETISAGS